LLLPMGYDIIQNIKTFIHSAFTCFDTFNIFYLLDNRVSRASFASESLKVLYELL